MIEFQKLTGRNFLSFKELDFSFSGHDFLLILGQNSDSESSSSNGSGKSALLEALVWVLFGRTLRNLTYDEVVNNQIGKDCLISLSFASNGGTYALERYRKDSQEGNALRLFEGKKELTEASNKETQNLLEQLIGMNFEIFMNSVAFPQGSAQFFSTLSDSEQKSILERMLSLETLSEAQIRVKADLKTLELSISQNELKLSNLQTKQETVEAQSEQLKRSHLAFEEDRQQAIKELLQQIRAEKEKTQELNEFKANKLRQQHSLKVKITKNTELLSGMEEKQDESGKLESKLYKVEAKEESLKREAGGVSRKLTNIKVLKGKATCPTCGQSVSGKLVEEQRKALELELEDLSVQQDEVLDEKEEIRLQLRELEKEFTRLSELEVELSRAKNTLEASQKELWEFQSSVELSKERANQLKEQAYELKSKTNPHQESIAEVKKTLGDLSQEVEKVGTEKDNLEEEREYLNFWVAGFGDRGLKSFILDSVVPTLNDETNKCLSILSDGTIKASFHTQTQLKGGEMREKFGLDIWTENGADRYLGLSGGEQRRLNLAVLMSLRRLAQMQAGAQCNLLLADEIFDALDQPGLERAVELLKVQRQNGAKVIVISHSDELQEHFQDILVVQKEDGVSRLLIEESVE